MAVQLNWISLVRLLNFSMKLLCGFQIPILQHSSSVSASQSDCSACSVNILVLLVCTSSSVPDALGLVRKMMVALDLEVLMLDSNYLIISEQPLRRLFFRCHNSSELVRSVGMARKGPDSMLVPKSLTFGLVSMYS
ncbi:hypothetical protein Tco_0841682 [Tanacetum coccineum]|uniref:Secreted protein n=1 Tax=Tanacetum coccineum TaxID=301880 RepID=A0ABQ5AX26_9ASTR